MKFNLYGDNQWASITLDGLLEIQREEGMLWAHAEDSGSESCFCEVARWNNAAECWERFAFCKFADYRFLELPDATDEDTAEYAANLINDVVWYAKRAKLVHLLPDWSGELGPKATLPFTDETRITEVLRDDDLYCCGTIGDLKAYGGRLIDKLLDAPAAVFKVEGDDRWWAASVELVTAEAAAGMVHDILAEHEAEQAGKPDDKVRPKAIRCSACGLLVECDGDPGPVGAVRIPGNHEAVERDGFATPTELPECPGSCLNGMVEAVV